MYILPFILTMCIGLLHEVNALLMHTRVVTVVWKQLNGLQKNFEVTARHQHILPFDQIAPNYVHGQNNM